MKDILKLASTEFFEVKSVEGDSKEGVYIEGFASTTVKDRDGEIIPTGSIKYTDFLKNPILLYQHKHDEPIGKIEEIEQKENGLWIKAFVSSTAEKAITLIKEGILKTFSIGFRVLDYDYNEAIDAWILKENDLYEVSVVSIPANQDAIFSMAKSFGEEHNFKKPNKSTENVQTKQKEIDMTLEEMQKKMKEMEDALKGEKDAKEALILEKAEKEKAEKMAAEKAEKEALKTEIKGVDEKVGKVTELIESITESLKTVTEEIETLKSTTPRVQSVPVSEDVIKNFMEDYKDAYVCSKLFKKDFQDTFKFGKMPERAKAISIDSTFLELVDENWQSDVRAKASILPLFTKIPYNTTSDIVPYTPGMTSAWGSVSANNWTPGKVTCTAYSIFSSAAFNYVTDEEAIISWLPQLRADISTAIADGIDAAILDDDATHSNTFSGITAFANAASYKDVVATNDEIVVADVDSARASMGKYGVKAGDCILALSPTAYFTLVDEDEVSTVDKYGSNATILTGELAKVRGIPVIVNESVPYVSGAGTNHAIGILFNRRMFFVKTGDFMLEFDKTITTQVSNIVGSMRVGFIPTKPLSSGAIDAPFAYSLTNATS